MMSANAENTTEVQTAQIILAPVLDTLRRRSMKRRVLQAVYEDGLSFRQAAFRFGIPGEDMQYLLASR